MAGFFSKLEETGIYVRDFPNCRACGLLNHCRSPKMPVYGNGKRSILVVGEAPGEVEDKRGRPFVGKTGQFLRGTLPCDLDDACWTMNSVICRPLSRNGKNRKPESKELDHCRANVLNAIADYRPKVVLLLGDSAIRSVLTTHWQTIGDMGRWVGWKIPSRRFNTWIVPTHHPSFIVRMMEKLPVQKTVWKQHLKTAFAATDHPPDPIDYRSKVMRIYDAVDAAAKLLWMLNRPAPIAWDLETNMIKPDHSRARIYSCSVCWNGERTIAFPWQQPAIDAMKKLLLSEVHPKIGANIKFEERWVIAQLGIRVVNWDFDVVEAAHVLDNRKNTSSVKFQSFVRFGVELYDNKIRDYLEPKNPGCNVENRIREIPIEDLLLYNGMDSVLEYDLATVLKGLLKWKN